MGNVPECIWAFEKALEARYLEGAELIERGSACGGFYLQGYVAELALKGAVFRILGKGETDEITRRERENQIRRGRQHDPSEWMEYLFSVRGEANPLDQAVKENLRDAVHAINSNWSINLRYRDIEPDPREIQEFTNAVDWIIMNRDRLS